MDNYGLAITGIVDEDRVCLRVQLTADAQEPEMLDGSTQVSFGVLESICGGYRVVVSIF